jgi:hypothetical protein
MAGSAMTNTPLRLLISKGIPDAGGLFDSIKQRTNSNICGLPTSQ